MNDDPKMKLQAHYNPNGHNYIVIYGEYHTRYKKKLSKKKLSKRDENRSFTKNYVKLI